MCRGSEAGSYERLIDLVYHSTLDLRVKRRKKKSAIEENYLSYAREKSTRSPWISYWITGNL